MNIIMTIGREKVHFDFNKRKFELYVCCLRTFGALAPRSQLVRAPVKRVDRRG